ncbi:hypothetical protein N7508_008137 [Penicillium antarcticum]|uniref:uncharacterized protein n=1 Tax=Penicillium antarcticum TaxID=416450 RepID=UPI00238CD772|nr:uncharacterized protein N7508_008137 [Penicillium antarcticum]KAJ5297888.1 hypothetical protein N7508_008137 [Penicillium antarcticum]
MLIFWPPLDLSTHHSTLHLIPHAWQKMVGVGGRSKGCRTCRRRKVKCDEGQPLCQRCKTAGIQCDGYVQFSEFIDERNRLVKRGTIKLPSPSSSTTISNHNSPFSEKASEHIQPLNFTTNLPWNEDDLLNTHLINRIFTWHEDPASPYAASWISALFKQNKKRNLSNASMRALATVYFAKVNKQSQLMRRGASVYSQALSMLRSQLQNSDLAVSDDVVIAVIYLGIYESVTFTQPGAWLAHYKGLARLAIGYIVERKRCFLEDPTWKKVPWALKGEDAKTPTDRLHDILVDIPGILEDTSQSKTWDPAFPGKDEFDTRLIPRVLSTLETTISDTISDPLLPRQGTRNDVAVEICRMVDYHLHYLRRSSGAFMLIFPLNVAHNHLDVGSVEARRWLEGVMAVIADSHGFELGRSENMPRRVSND